MVDVRGQADAEAALVDIHLPEPVPTSRDLLVQVLAISVNPVDTKVRKRAKPDAGNWQVTLRIPT